MTPPSHARRRPCRAFLSLAARVACAVLGAWACLASAPTPARAEPPISDAGTYRVYQNDQLIGTEEFWFFTSAESLLIRARVSELLPRPGFAPDTLQKGMQLLMSPDDRDMHTYLSQEILSGVATRRELTMLDTTYSSTREFGQRGFTDVYVRPPGRIYPVDPQVFTLYHLMVHDVQAQGVDDRGVLTLYLAGKDTTAETRVTRLGKESVKLGGRLYPADKFRVKDDWSEFLVWLSPKGQMLKLTMPSVGLRVERDPKTLLLKNAPSAVQSIGLPPPPPKVLR